MSQVCNRCGMPVRSGFKFCNVCGAQIVEGDATENTVDTYSPLQSYKGRAVRVLTGEKAGMFFPAYPTCTIGTEGCDITMNRDNTLSPHHACVTARPDMTIIEDNGSLNGVFLRARDKVILQDNDIILAGDHYFLYEFMTPDHFSGEYGTEFYGAPCRGEHFRLVEILSGGRRGRACMAPDGGIIVGRSEGDFQFSEDEHMSPRHFTIRWTQRGGILVDMSHNGTFVQIHEPTPVTSGDIFFAGTTLFEII